MATAVVRAARESDGAQHVADMAADPGRLRMGKVPRGTASWSRSRDGFTHVREVVMLGRLTRFLNNSSINGHAAEPSAEGADPYVAARDYSLDEAARERTTARSWRRVASTSLVLSLGLVANNVVTTAKLRGPAEALVLTQDDRGAMRLLGRAGEAPVPSDIALQAGVRTWLEDVRSIPGIDYALAQEQKRIVLAMTDANGPVRTEVDTCTANAAKLGKYEIRAVSSVDVTPLPVSAGAPARTYIVRWAEQTTKTADVTTAQHSGQVTIANNAAIPTDPQVAVLNPAGVYVEQKALDVPLC